MELKFDLSKVLTRADQVEVGKEYYFFDEIRPCIKGIHFERAKLTYINDDVDYPFGIGESAHSYAYPIPEKKTRPMTFNEIVEYWKKHRTEIFHYADERIDESFMIQGFERYEVNNVPKAVIYINDSCLDYYTFINDVTREDGSKFEVEL